MRDSSQVWCETTAVISEQIDRRAAIQLELFKSPDKVYLSPDIYAAFMKEFPISAFYGCIHEVNYFRCCAGELRVVRLEHFTNICFVGEIEEWERYKWMEIDKQFEEEVLS
jgi:hypothetical protein